MLSLLPSLPFMQTVDILFRHEGISGLERCFKGKGLFLFLRRHFKPPMWADAICMCVVVLRLRHPAHAVYLQCPVDPSVPDSMRAWSVMERLDFAPPIKPLLIRAMWCFLPDDGPVYDFLSAWDLRIVRTPEEWEAFALETIRNHQFTERWWAKDCVCRGIDGADMPEAIRNAAAEEWDRLPSALLRLERMRVLGVKRQRKVAGKPPRLTFAEEQAAKNESEQHLAQHRGVAAEVAAVLESGLSTQVFDAKFDHVARLVMSLAHVFPKMRWSLKLLFHKAAADRLALGTWHVERCLERQRGFRDHEPLHCLRRLC